MITICGLPQYAISTDPFAGLPLRMSFKLWAGVLLGLLVSALLPTLSFADVVRAHKDDAKSAAFKLADFSRLQIDGAADVTAKQGSDNEIVIEAIPQTRERIQISQDGNHVKISLNSGWKFWNSSAGSIKILVTFKTIEDIAMAGAGDFHGKGKIKVPKLAIRMAGAGDFEFDELHTDDLRVSMAGAGDAKLGGEAKSASIGIAGAGNYIGEHFKTQKARISIAGAGDAKIWATEELSISIAGAGSVSHWGRPKIVKQSIAGVGSVTDKGSK